MAHQRNDNNKWSLSDIVHFFFFFSRKVTLIFLCLFQISCPLGYGAKSSKAKEPTGSLQVWIVYIHGVAVTGKNGTWWPYQPHLSPLLVYLVYHTHTHNTSQERPWHSTMCCYISGILEMSLCKSWTWPAMSQNKLSRFGSCGSPHDGLFFSHVLAQNVPSWTALTIAEVVTDSVIPVD